MAQAKDEKLSEESKSLSEEVILVSEEVSFGYNGLMGWVEDKCILG